METKLSVKNLRISFRTNSGRVQAVRDINFDLNKGETLAIVGESGSGKSVTSKAILGISAPNAIIEGGEILYDKMDLLKIPEDDFYKIRGDKIAMIFQDPMSSLNPIMRIGKQLTEAMLLKGKARQKASRKEFNDYLALLKKTMVENVARGDDAKTKQIEANCANFNKFEFKHLELEQEYNNALDAAKNAIPEIKNLLLLIEKNAVKEPRTLIREILEMGEQSLQKYVVAGENETALKEAMAAIKANKSSAIRSKDYSSWVEPLNKMMSIEEKSIELPQPNFFSMGYYLTFSKQPLPELSVEETNKLTHEYLDKDFMLAFIDDVKLALAASAEQHYEKKALSVHKLKAARTILSDESNEKAIDLFEKEFAELKSLVEQSNDPLELIKDSFAYTFASSVEGQLESHKAGTKKNAKELARFQKQQDKYNRILEKTGKEPNWKPVPAALVDDQKIRENILSTVSRLCDRYEEQLGRKAERKYNEEAVAVIDYLKLNASGVVKKVTRRMAKQRAIKLMEEVGISEPRKRFKQYPFEYSGGMRQRIVIAIALAADPDILICDEPTTALDVTIQAQILELINKLKRERNLTIIFITHDLGVVANMADKIAVMYAGKIVEYGTSDDIFYRPAHPYTWALLSSMPDLDTNDKLESIPGRPPNMIFPPKGDAFAARNKYAMKIDFEEQPPMFQISDTHSAATWLLHPDAPKIEMPKIISDRIERMKKKEEANDGRQ